jgi:hypothetical protein
VPREAAIASYNYWGDGEIKCDEKNKKKVVGASFCSASIADPIDGCKGKRLKSERMVDGG